MKNAATMSGEQRAMLHLFWLTVVYIHDWFVTTSFVVYEFDLIYSL